MLYDVYFKPAMSGIITVEANSEEEAKQMIEEGIYDVSKVEIIEKLTQAMQIDDYCLEVIGVECVADDRYSCAECEDEDL